MSDDRPARYVEDDGRVIYRASAMGGCPRALMLTGLGYTGEPWGSWFQEVLDEGTRMEDEILAGYTTNTGHEIVDRQREYDLELLEGVFVRCHIDGKYPNKTSSGGDLVVDAKKIRAGGWNEFARRGVEMHMHWVWQVAAIQHATGCSRFDLVGGLYRPADAEKGVTEGIDKVRYRVYSEPVLPLKALRRKVWEVEELIAANPDPTTVACAPKMFPCPYRSFHDEEEVVSVSAHKDADVLRSLLKRRAEADKAMAEVKGAYEGADAERRSAGQGIVAWLEAVAGEVGLKDTESWKVELDGVEVKVVYTKGGPVKDRAASRSYRT